MFWKIAAMKPVENEIYYFLCNLGETLILFQVKSKIYISNILSHSLCLSIFLSLSVSIFYKHFEEFHEVGMFYYLHNSTNNRTWYESCVMRFDQTLKLNETWHELARGPMRDDIADSLLEKHLVRPLPPPSGLSTASWPHATCPGAFPPSSMSRGSHQTPPPQIPIS